MQISQRKAGILLNYINEAVKILTALVYTPVMLRLLGQSEYGLYQLVSSVVSYLSLLSLGFGSAYVRYHSRYRVKDDHQGIARLNGMFLLIFGTMSAVCLVCGGIIAGNAKAVFGNGLTAEELPKAKVLLQILVVNMALTFPNSVFDCYVTAHEQFVFQKLLRTLQSLLNPFLTLPLLLLGYGSVAMVLVSTALTVTVFAGNLYFCFRKLNMRFCFRGLQFSLLREMWVFTFFIFLNQIIDQVNWSVDKFLLGRMSGTAAVAVYGIGGQVNSLYIQTSTAVSSVFVPKVNRIVAKTDDNTELTQLMTRVGRIQFAILALIVSGFALFGKSFVWLWAGEVYAQAYFVALLLMVPVTVPLIQNMGIEIQRAKNMHKARSVVYACIAAANVILSIWMIRCWGCVGAAAGTALALIFGNILFMNWYYHRKIGLDMIFFWKQIAGFLPGLLAAGFAGFILQSVIPISGWGMLLAAAVLYGMVYCGILWILAFNDYEKRLIRDVLKKLRIIR